MDKKHKLLKPNEAQKEFADSFNHFAYRFGYSEVFCDFVDYALLVFKWHKPNIDFSFFEEKYGNHYKYFPQMFEYLGIASDTYHDALGDLFMELVSHGKNGQFFTPEPLADFMSQCGGSKIEDELRILDPACGSSRLLLAAARRNRNVYLYGCDNDIICCKISLVNMLLNTLRGEIALMDTLQMKFHKSWVFDYINIDGVNFPYYYEIDNKDNSQLWKMHINTFHNSSKTNLSSTKEKQQLQLLFNN